MGYLALRFATDASAAHAWSDALLAAGAVAVDFCDPHAETARETAVFGEPGEPGPTLWPVTQLTALFQEGASAATVIEVAEAAMTQALPPHITFDVPDQDWVRATQAQFEPLRITDTLWIVPSWRDPVAGAVNLILDPGLAFGTGSHPTTRLCLRWLASDLPPQASVLDYGCGSGILAIAASRLGARVVVGVDVDPQAIVASEANAARNGVAGVFLLPDALAAKACAPFDVVVANILANPLRMLAPALATRVRGGGHIVLSGILEDQAAVVTSAYDAWFRIHVWQRDEGWVALVGERRSSRLD